MQCGRAGLAAARQNKSRARRMAYRLAGESFTIAWAAGFRSDAGASCFAATPDGGRFGDIVQTTSRSDGSRRNTNSCSVICRRAANIAGESLANVLKVTGYAPDRMKLQVSPSGHEFKVQAFPQGQYIGDFQAGGRHGMGRFEYSNGNIYVGSWQTDRKSGYACRLKCS
jgi:hypothetical protein